MGMTMLIYLLIAIVLWIWKEAVISILTNISNVQISAKELFGMILFGAFFQIIYENGKYALQTIGKSRWVLILTAIVNGLFLGMLFLLEQLQWLDFTGIIVLVALNYFVLGALFLIQYRRVLGGIQ